MRTTKDVIRVLGKSDNSCSVPEYKFGEGSKVMAAVKGMETHMTDEGSQLQKALEHAGYTLSGYQYDSEGTTDVADILKRYDPVGTFVFQDKREWMGMTADVSKCPKSRFVNCGSAKDPSIFRLTVLKDAHHHQGMNREFCEEIGCHAWIVYYHPDIVHSLAPYTRREHLIRTYHSIDSNAVPPYSNRTLGAFISGALSRAYPLRNMLVRYRGLTHLHVIPHPGYAVRVPHSANFLQKISKYKVSICTCSVYGYSLRKIIESVACGCKVITDLPVDDPLPHIDEALIRVPSNKHPYYYKDVIAKAVATYDSDRAEHFSNLAKLYYDYRYLGNKLALDIEKMRRNFQ